MSFWRQICVALVSGVFLLLAAYLMLHVEADVCTWAAQHSNSTNSCTLFHGAAMTVLVLAISTLSYLVIMRAWTRLCFHFYCAQQDRRPRFRRYARYIQEGELLSWYVGASDFTGKL